jgi:hypothetical protein
MVGGMAMKLLGDALTLATDVAKHVVWYLTHQIDGRPRDRT